MNLTVKDEEYTFIMNFFQNTKLHFKVKVYFLGCQKKIDFKGEVNRKENLYKEDYQQKQMCLKL